MAATNDESHDTFSLERFERLALRREHEAACRELLLLLSELEHRRGRMPASLTALVPSHLPAAEGDQLLCTRIAAAAAALLGDPTLRLAAGWQTRVLSTQRWLAAVFEASHFGDADHVLRAMSVGDDGTTITVTPASIAKFCWLYTPQSQLPLDLTALWQHDRALAAGLAIALLSPRLLASSAAFGKREQILPWLAANLGGVDDIDQLPVHVLHDVYMHCSYALRPDKHDVKRAINGLISRSLQRRGLLDTPADQLRERAAAPGKPVMLVVLEWFSSQHSIYRTHSLTIEAAREHFEVIGIGLPQAVDTTSIAVFDHFIALDAALPHAGQLRQIQAIAQSRQAQLLYLPSVGMFPLTMMLANLRVAPLQVMALGHPATAHARAMDLVVVEEHYVGDPACFSEKLLRLPMDGIPYRPIAGDAAAGPAAVPARPPGDEGDGAEPAVVQIALCAAAMKLNPPLLAACAEIAVRSRVRVHFHLLVSQAQGLMVPTLNRLVRQALGHAATVWPEQPVADYRAVITRCDLFINPFPFGNTNGTIDCIAAGLVGVCKTGPEVHEHIDEGMFRRLGLPDWLITHSVEDYVEAAVRLANNHAERRALSAVLAGPDKVAVFYRGRPALMGRMLLDALLALPAGPAS